MIFKKNNVNARFLKGDCLEKTAEIEDGTIDTVICDLPYGTTSNNWDTIIDNSLIWKVLDRVCKKGANIILTSAQPFTNVLIETNKAYCLSQNKSLNTKIMELLKGEKKEENIPTLMSKLIELNSSNKKSWFRYCDIYEKLTNASGQLNVNKMPLRKHEDILVFRKPGKPIKDCTYNEEILYGFKPYKIKRSIKKEDCYHGQKEHVSVNEGSRRAISIMRIKNPRIKGGHPTQKPYELMERLIKIYSNENDTVLDLTCGSGVTGIACLKNNRNFIGCELDAIYFKEIKNNFEKEGFFNE